MERWKIPFDPQVAVRAFEGATIEDSGHPLRYQVHKLGRLRLPTGSVVAADILVFPGWPPFARRVPAGSYRVDVAVAHLATGESYVAFARLTFGTAAPVSWELALTEADADDAQPPASPGYGVDSGVGGFMDASHGELTTYWFRENEMLGQLMEGRILKKLDHPQRGGAGGAIVRPAFWRRANFAFFSSGRGDGTYVSYFGLDARGSPVQLITDFKVRNPGDSILLEIQKERQQQHAPAG